MNRLRLAALDDVAAHSEAQTNLEQEAERFRQQIEQQLESPNLTPKQRTILKNARKNLEALTVFVKHPHIPMDNNRAERLLHLAALGRKNYYGCHAEWSAEFTAVCLSIIQTAAMHGLNVEAYLRYVLDELALHRGEHPAIDALLPWNIPESKLRSYTMKTGSPPCMNTNFPETSAVGL